MALEAKHICLQVLKESTTNKFDSFNRQEQCIDHTHVAFRDCRVHIFYDNLSRNSCKE